MTLKKSSSVTTSTYVLLGPVNFSSNLDVIQHVS